MDPTTRPVCKKHLDEEVKMKPSETGDIYNGSPPFYTFLYQKNSELIKTVLTKISSKIDGPRSFQQ